jgi:hypothetical protein
MRSAFKGSSRNNSSPSARRAMWDLRVCLSVPIFFVLSTARLTVPSQAPAAVA